MRFSARFQLDDSFIGGCNVYFRSSHRFGALESFRGVGDLCVQPLDAAGEGEGAQLGQAEDLADGAEQKRTVLPTLRAICFETRRNRNRNERNGVSFIGQSMVDS